MARRDLVLVFLGIVLLAGGALLLLGVIGGDAPAVADADLTVERPAVPPQENAYSLLHQAAQHLRWEKSQEKRLDALALGTDWDPSLARTTARSNAEALRLLDRALERPALQVPASRHRADVWGQSGEWQKLATISAVRAIRRARRGDAEGALADALVPLRLGRLVESSYDSRFDSGIECGLLLERTGIDSLAAAIPHLAPSEAESRHWNAALGRLRSDPAAWRRLWAWEYRSAKRGLPLPTRWEMEHTPQELRPSDVLAWMATLGLWKYEYKPNATLQLYADWIRQLQVHAGRTCARMPGRPVSDWETMNRSIQRFGPNSWGKLQLSQWTGYDLYIERFRCQVDAQAGSVAVLLALRAYQVEHGDVPASLAALVPDEIASIPTSTMDGRPLRYSRSARTVCANERCESKGLPKPEKRSSTCGCRNVSVGLPISF